MVKSKGWVGHHPATDEGEDQAGERERTLVVTSRYPYTASMASMRRWKLLALKSATRRSPITEGREVLEASCAGHRGSRFKEGAQTWSQLQTAERGKPIQVR